MMDSDCKWEFECPVYVDFHHVNDENSQEDWFDIDHENYYVDEAPPKVRPLPFIKSPLKELNVEAQVTDKFAVNRNILTNYDLKKPNEMQQPRTFHLKTKPSAGRQTELKRISLSKQLKKSNLSTSSSISSISSQSKNPKNIENENHFVDNLRKYDSPEPGKSYVPKNTIPVPFSFSREPPKKTAVEEFRSMAQQVIAYQTITPVRFRLKPRRASTGEKKPNAREIMTSYSAKKPCVPRSPLLETKTRVRPPTVQSQQEIEEAEYEKMKNYRFHAKPLKTEMFRQSYCALPQKQVKGATTVMPFHFHTRVTTKPPKTFFSEAQSTFRARAVPTEILQRTVGIPHVPKRRSVQVQPFSFEEYDKHRQKTKEQKMNKYYEEEKRLREFHANPLPDLQLKGIPEKQQKPKTIVKPFDFISDHKDLHNLDKKRMAAEMERINAVVKFKARPMQNNSPFIPKKPNRFLTNVVTPPLRSSQRAIERENYNQFLKERDERRIDQEKERRLREQEEELKEISKLRSNIVHKAKPIRHYKAIEKLEVKEPTSPISPLCRNHQLGRGSSTNSM